MKRKVKTKYRRVEVTTVKGIRTAERLKANGWKIVGSSPWAINFYKPGS